MNPARISKARISKARIFGLLAASLLLSGCGEDKPYSGPDPTPQVSYSDPAPDDTGDAPDPTLPPDPLLSGLHGTTSPDNPLLKSSAFAPSDPLADTDPLKGRKMPTDHSHWLRGRVQGARLTVLLNGIPDGDYTGFVDKDITMKLRAGVNTVSFVYTPQNGHASARMDLLESEHHPAIAPLATFQSLPQPSEATEFSQTTQRFTFVAH